MKRTALLQFLSRHGCRLLREGAKHSIWINEENQAMSAVPRHSEIKDFLASKICKDLEIPSIKNK